MGYELAPFFLSNRDWGSSDDWPNKGGAEEVDVLIDCVALYCWEAELLYKLVVEVLNVAFLCTDLQRLFTAGLETFLLADCGHEADNIAALLN